MGPVYKYPEIRAPASWLQDELGIVKQEELPVGLLERTSPRSSEGRSSSSRRTPHSPTNNARRYHKRKQREEAWPKGNPDESLPPVPPGPTTSSSPDVLHRERPVCLVRGSIFIEDYIEVSRHATAGETITARDYTSSLAGKGVIQAIAISRAGQRAELAGAIGADGATIPTYLTTFGIGTSRCKKPEVTPGTPVHTGRIVNQYTRSDDVVKIIVTGANTHTLDSAEELLIPPITHLVLQNEVDLSLTSELIDVAHDRGIITILNPSPLPHASQIHALPWQKVDYLVISEDEAEVFAGYLPNDPPARTTASGRTIRNLRRSEPPDLSSGRFPIHQDSRIAAGLGPPLPKQAYSTLSSLMSWTPLSRTGIVMKLRAPGGGALAVLPFAHAQTSKIYYEPAPVRDLALGCPAHIATGSPGSDGSTDALLGYFVAGLMEYSLFDRMKLDDQVWKDVLEKAVTASFMTPTGFPPIPPIPLYAVPHYPEVHRMMSYLRTCYMRQQQSGTSVRPFTRSEEEGEEAPALLSPPEDSPRLARPQRGQTSHLRRPPDTSGRS